MESLAAHLPSVAVLVDVAAHGLIGVACLGAAATIGSILAHRRDFAAVYRRVGLLVGMLLAIAGASSAMAALSIIDGLTSEATTGVEGPRLAALLRLALALFGVGALVVMWRLPGRIAALPSHADLRRANTRLLAEAEAHVRTLKELRQARDELEERVEERTLALADRTRDYDEARRRYELALRSSEITLFIQDSDLRYLWVSRSWAGHPVDAVIGRTDDDILPAGAGSRIAAVKHAAIESGEHRDAEVPMDLDGETRWWDLHVEPARSPGLAPDAPCDRLYGTAVEITERKLGEQRLRFLMREVTHRSKNMLAVIQAMARQTAIASDTVPEFLNRFGQRLQSLSASQDLVVDVPGAGVPIDILIRSQLGHAVDAVGDRITLAGPRLVLSGDATQHLGLALHELSTNAVKYGALSNDEGRVSIEWSLDGSGLGADDCFRMRWREAGGPPVSRPSRRGFGQVVIERTVGRALQGEVDLDYAESGLVWSLKAPARAVLAQPDD